MPSLADVLLNEIRDIPLIDPHSHVEPHAPTATGLDDLLGYHYYTELAHSAGLPKESIEGTGGRQQCRNICAKLTDCDNTVQVHWLMRLARNLFGFDDDRLTAGNVDRLFDAVEAATAAPDWAEQVRGRTNLEAIFLTNDFDDPLEGFDTDVYVPCLRTDDLVFKLHEPAVRRRFAEATDLEPDGRQNVVDGIGRLFEHFVAKGARACAISLPPWFEPVRPGLAEAERVLGGPQHGEADRRVVAQAVFHAIADRCREHGLPFDLMVGVHRQVYPAGVFQGQDLYDRRVSLHQYRHLFNAYPEVTFPVSVLDSTANQELASYAWIFPNVVASGHWWYSNIPGAIERDLRHRLEAVPKTKLVGYYSDAYKLEFVLPKFDMYRRCLADVLARDFVQARRWPEERAVELARTVLRGNVERLFPAPARQPATATA